jgi:hypothetical protein
MSSLVKAEKGVRHEGGNSFDRMGEFWFLSAANWRLGRNKKRLVPDRLISVLSLGNASAGNDIDTGHMLSTRRAIWKQHSGGPPTK